MIVAPSGVKVRIACGLSDMRKDIDGLATLSIRTCYTTRSRTTCSISSAAKPTSSRSSTRTAPGLASSPSGLSTGSSNGRPSAELMRLSVSLRRSSPC